MYQNFVIGLGILAVAGLGYFINHADSQGIVIGSATKKSVTVIAIPPDDIPGTYTCDSASGCENPKTLVIMAGGEATMRTTYENGAEIVEEMGSWTFVPEQGIQLAFTGTQAQVYQTPHALLIRKLESDRLGTMEFDHALFSGMENPYFTRRLGE
jgi:hypothetical protein